MRRLEFPFVLLWTTLMVAPALAVGYLRDDWLMLWKALDPGTAPAGAAGAFPRPLAELQWFLAAQGFGADARAMHVMALVAWLGLAWLLWRWMRTRAGAVDGLDLERLLLVAWVVSHAALVETRLWAAASNGVWAVALALAGAHLYAWQSRTGLLFFLCAALFRADALVLLALPLSRRLRRQDRPEGIWRAGLLVVGVGVAALALMLAFGGGWSFAPSDAGEALRRLVLPFGPPLPDAAAVALAVVGLGAGVFALTRDRGHALLWLALLGSLAAQAVTSWSAAGRYLLAPVILSAVLLESRARPAWMRRGLRPVLILLLALQAVAAWRGHTATEIRAVAARETQLYRLVHERATLRADTLRVADPPALGWTSSAADLENVVSAARLRPVVVEILPDAADPRADLRYEDGAWRWARREGGKPGDPLELGP